MFHRTEVTTNTALRVTRYPWDKLAAVGDQLMLHGPALQPYSAQFAAHVYFRRHGVKIKTSISMGSSAGGEKSILITRIT